MYKLPLSRFQTGEDLKYPNHEEFVLGLDDYTGNFVKVQYDKYSNRFFSLKKLSTGVSRSPYPTYRMTQWKPII